MIIKGYKNYSLVLNISGSSVSAAHDLPDGFIPSPYKTKAELDNGSSTYVETALYLAKAGKSPSPGNIAFLTEWLQKYQAQENAASSGSSNNIEPTEEIEPTESNNIEPTEEQVSKQLSQIEAEINKEKF